jgi:hypothetical protein
MDSSSPPQPRRSDRPSGPTSCLGCRNCTMCLTQVLRQCSTLRGGDGSIVHRWWKIVWCEAQRSTKSKGRMHLLQMLHCACRALATILKCEQNFQVRACPRFGCSFPAFHLFRGRRAAGSASASDLLRSATADRAAGPAQVRGSCAGSASPNKISCRHPSISHGLSGGNCGRSPAMGAAHGRR